MDEERFRKLYHTYACEAGCPKLISVGEYCKDEQGILISKAGAKNNLLSIY